MDRLFALLEVTDAPHLGKFAGIKKLKNNETVQEFTGGSDCTPQPPRVSYIKFACGPNVSTSGHSSVTISFVFRTCLNC
jgi:hypothetical protein